MTLANYCYSSMFWGCTGLTAAPELLPATTLANYCYPSMFAYCTGLTAAPELPAMSLAFACYQYMFAGCTGLTAAPELPATTLANSCYSSMFVDCTGLTAAPELPATTMENYCYTSMFKGCTGIKLSTVQTDVYSIPYRIPTEGEIANAKNALSGMFSNTGGTFTGTPSINTTYYLSPPHDHDFTYLADGASVTATCGKGCDITEGLTLTISAPTGELVYDGETPYPAALSTDYNTTAFPGEYSITYTKNGEAFAGTPVEAGAYTASVTVGTTTASVSYTVAKADPAYTAPTGLTARCGDKLDSVILPDVWTWDDPSATVGVVGADARTKDVTCKATFTPADTDNYNAVTDVDVTVTVSHVLEDHDAQTPTCTEIGWEAYRTCENCDYTEYVEIPATDHDYRFDSFVWAADNTTAQVKLVCEHCEDEQFVDASMSHEDHAATCGADAYTVYTATYGDETDSKTVTATGTALTHNYLFDSFVWAADNTTAQAKYVCANDAEHVLFYDAVVTSAFTAATCEADAYTVYTATYDGHTEDKTVTDEDTATGNHDYTGVEWTYEDADQHVGICTVCGQPKYEAHDVIVRGDGPATCGAAGYTGDKYCSVCGEKLSEGTVIQPTGNHVYGTTGDARFTCTVCGQVDDERKAAAEAADQLAADKAAFNTYKTAAKAAAGDKIEDGDSAACRRLILNAKNAITALTYDESKTLDENKAAVDAILAKLDTDLAAQREADAAAPEEEEEETPCPLCGGKHGQSTIGRLIRVIHRIIALIKEIYGAAGKLAA